MFVRRVSTLVVLAVLATVLSVVPTAVPVAAQADPPTPVAKTVLMIVGDPNGLSSLDAQLETSLSASYDVTTLDDDGLSQMVIANDGTLRSVSEFDAVVITVSVSNSAIDRFMLKSSVPILVLKPSTWSKLGLAPTDPATGATPLQSLKTATTTTTGALHPVMDGLAASFDPFDHANPKNSASGWEGATLHAATGFTALADGPEGVAAFAYEPLTLLGHPFVDSTDVSQDCRVGIPAHNTTPYSTAGLTLFTNAMDWLTGENCGLQGHISSPASPALAQRMCTVDAADESIHFDGASKTIIDIPDPNPAEIEPNLSSLWVRAMSHDPGTNTLYIGGRFENAQGTNGTFAREGVFGCDLDTGEVTSFDAPIEIDPLAQNSDPALNPPVGPLLNERVRALAFDGQYLYVGGKFRFSPDVNLPGAWHTSTRYNLFRIDPATNTVDLTWAPNIRGGVSALATHGDWLYVSGGVWEADGTPMSRLARVSLSTGEVDASFRPMFIPNTAVGGTLFASVLALEVAGDRLLAAGSFDYVNAAPDEAAWTLHSDKLDNGTALSQAELDDMGAVRRNSVVAFDLNTMQLTPFSPSIGDNNLGTDEIAQIKDVVADGQGNVFLCGDWWVTSPDAGKFWVPFDVDNGATNPNDGSWEGQVSKYQPRPNQHNFGKFSLATGASAMVDGEVWGAATDGGVQACDYDAASDTLVIGGHYERIGQYDADYVDTATPENNYPAGQVPLEKLNAISGSTGEVIEWDPDIDSIRGLDVVRVIDGAAPGESLVAVGGAFTESDREPMAGLALYGFRTSRDPDIELPPEWALHRVEAVGAPGAPGAIEPTILQPAPAGGAQGTPWTPGPDPADAAGQNNDDGLLGLEAQVLGEAEVLGTVADRTEVPAPIGNGSLQSGPFDSSGPGLKPEELQPKTSGGTTAGKRGASTSDRPEDLGWNVDPSGALPFELDLTGALQGVEARGQIVNADVATAVSPFGAAVILDIERNGVDVEPTQDFEIEFDVEGLPIAAASDANLRIEVVWHSNCVFRNVRRGQRGVVPEAFCEAETVLDVDLASKRGRAIARVDASEVRRNLDRSPLKGRNALAPDVAVDAGGNVIVQPIATPINQLNAGLAVQNNALQAGDGGFGGDDMVSLRAGNGGPGGDYGASPVAPNSTYQVGEFAGTLNLGYGIEVPAPYAGPAPSVSLAYNSGGIDNFKPDTNNQSGPIGVGWSLGASGVIQRSIEPCGSIDICAGDEFSINLGGVGSKLVKKTELDANRTEYRLEFDPMWRVIRTTAGNQNGHTGDHWEVTTPDGTTHYLGNTGDSVQWVPNNVGAKFAMAWHLASTEDVFGNTITYHYTPEIDRHGPNQRLYVRNVMLGRIDYTTNPSEGLTAPHARIRFNWEARCGSYAAGGISVNENGICDWATETGFVDTPWDLYCAAGATCSNDRRPAFWSARRLGSIQVQVHDDNSWKTLAVHDLLNEIVTPPLDHDGEQAPAKMALRGVQRRPGGDYAYYGFAQMEAELATANAPLATSDQGGGNKSPATTFSFGRTYLGASTGDGHAKGVAVRYASDGAATITMTVGGQSQQIPLPHTAGDGIEDFKTVVLDGINLRGIQNVSFSVSGAGNVHVNWFRFYADTYNEIPGQPPVRYDAATTGETPIDTAGIGTSVIADGFIFLNNRVLDGENGHTSMRLPRVAGVINETGGRLRVHYGQTKSCEVWTNKADFPPLENGERSWITNTHDCFPSYNTNADGDRAPNVFNKWKVRRTVADTIDGAGNVITSNETMRTDYGYGLPRYAAAPSGLREDFRGHAHTIVKQAAPNGARLSQRRIDWFQGVGADSGYGPDENWLAGRPKRTLEYGATGGWVRQTRHSWTADPYHSQVTATDGTEQARFIAPGRIDTTVKELLPNGQVGNSSVVTRVRHVYDGYGRLTELRNSGQVSPTNGTDDRSVRTIYATNTNDWVLSTPCEVITRTGATGGGTLSKTVTLYQGMASCTDAPTSAQPKDSRAYWSSGSSARTRFTYDAFGRLTKLTNPRGKSTDVTYDTVWGLEGSTRNVLGWGSDTSYDAYGRVSEVQGPNADELTNLSYDSYNRLTDVTAYATRAGAIPTTTYEYRTQTRPAAVKTNSLFDQGAGTYISTVSYVDGFGRPVQELSNAEQSGRILVTDRSYNTRGLLQYTTSPTLISGSIDGGFVSLNKANATSYSQNTYDGLGRVTSVRDITGTTTTRQTSTSYNLFTTTRVDSNGNLGGGPSNQVTSTTDAFGNLVRVQDSSGADTAYTYDDLNRLTTVTDVDGNTTSVSYDMLSRKTQLVDPDTGTWKYTYDATSNLRHQWNDDNGTRSFWTEFTYDGIDRPRVEYERSTGGRLATSIFTWDVSGPRVRTGELMQTTRRENPGVSTHFVIERPMTFDEFGRAKRMELLVKAEDGTYPKFRTEMTYGAGGQLLSQRYPANDSYGLGETVDYSYNSRTGAPVSVEVNDEVIADNIQLDEFGRLTHMTHGASGHERSNSFDPLTHRLSNVSAGTDGNLVLSLDYSYDNNGNITAMVDNTNGGQESCFTYDAAQRLTRAATSGFDGCGTTGVFAGDGEYEHDYTYDPIGNITSYGRADRAYTYGAGNAGPHAVTSITNPEGAAAWTFDYDIAGNMTRRNVGNGDQTFAYGYDQTVESITNPDGSTTSFLYTADDKRVRRDTDTTTTWYAFGVYEFEVDKATGDETERVRYSAAGQPVALDTLVNGAGRARTWTFGDHQGSASAFINPDGTNTSQRYYPFGHQRLITSSGALPGTELDPATAGLPTDRGYTDQVRDDSTGLLYYNARYYDPTTARFTRADTIVPDAANSADLNRYSYVRNSPPNYIDPSGHCAVDGSGYLICGENGFNYGCFSATCESDPVSDLADSQVRHCISASCSASETAIAAVNYTAVNAHRFDNGRDRQGLDGNISPEDFSSVSSNVHGDASPFEQWVAAQMILTGNASLFHDARSWYERGPVGFVWEHRETILAGVAFVGYLSCGVTAGAGCAIGAGASILGAASSAARAYDNCRESLSSFGCGEAVLSTALNVAGAGAAAAGAQAARNTAFSGVRGASPQLAQINTMREQTFIWRQTATISGAEFGITLAVDVAS